MTGDRKPCYAAGAKEAFSTPEKRAPRDSETRLESLRKALKEHCARHKPVWIAKESARLLEKRLRLGLVHPAPIGAHQSTDLPAITRQARRNVDARITRRLSRLNSMARTQRQGRARQPSDTRSLQRAFSRKSRIKL